VYVCCNEKGEEAHPCSVLGKFETHEPMDDDMTETGQYLDGELRTRDSRINL